MGGGEVLWFELLVNIVIDINFAACGVSTWLFRFDLCTARQDRFYLIGFHFTNISLLLLQSSSSSLFILFSSSSASLLSLLLLLLFVVVYLLFYLLLLLSSSSLLLFFLLLLLLLSTLTQNSCALCVVPLSCGLDCRLIFFTLFDQV